MNKITQTVDMQANNIMVLDLEKDKGMLETPGNKRTRSSIRKVKVKTEEKI